MLPLETLLHSWDLSLLSSRITDSATSAGTLKGPICSPGLIGETETIAQLYKS